MLEPGDTGACQRCSKLNCISLGKSLLQIYHRLKLYNAPAIHDSMVKAFFSYEKELWSLLFHPFTPKIPWKSRLTPSCERLTTRVRWEFSHRCETMRNWCKFFFASLRNKVFVSYCFASLRNRKNRFKTFCKTARCEAKLVAKQNKTMRNKSQNSKKNFKHFKGGG